MKELSREEALRKIFSSAYSFKKLGYYGSKEKAIKALSKRKGFEKFSSVTITGLFEEALKIFIDTAEFVDKEITRKTPLTQLTDEEVSLILNKLREIVSRQNLHAPKEMIQYASDWVYLNYYLR